MTPTPQCEFREAEDVEEYREQMQMRVEILDRFSEWARYFGIKTCLHEAKAAIRKVAKEGVVPMIPITVWEAK